MIQTICDCCRKPMGVPYITIEVTKPFPRLGELEYSEHHLCEWCATQIKDKFIGLTSESNPCDGGNT